MNCLQRCLFLCITFCCIFAMLEAQEANINVNFSNVDLEVFINTVAKITNKRILYDPTIKGKKIFLVSATPVTKDELYKIFLSVMEYNGFILETTGAENAELIKIKRNIQGPWTQTKTLYTEEELAKIKDEDHFISMVIKLKYISSREVQTTLRALRIVNPQGGNLAGIEGSNTILITDFAPNVKRIYDVIKMMDQQGPEKEFCVVKLTNAIAEDVVEKLNEFVVKGQAAASTMGSGPNMEEIKIAADSRLNAVIVQAYKEKMKRLIDLINELDQKLDEEPSSIHYMKLKHADATKLQETLGKLLESGRLSKKSSPAGGGTPAATASSSSSNAITTSIQAESQTNSLIIRADTQDWREIENIIKQVDVRRPQVLIEGALIEMSPDDMVGFGVELFWAESADNNKVTFGGNSDFGLSNLAVIDDSGDAKFITDKTTEITDAKQLGKVPYSTRDDFSKAATAFINYKDLFNIPALIKAIKIQGDSKILSVPSILTNDHERAVIKVADAAPSQSSTSENNGSRTDSFKDYQEAGTVLNITPHISGETNYLRLEIEQSIDEFDYSQPTVGGVPAKKVRKIATCITVPDGHTVAIGGFTSDTQTESIEKIPLLGDLPILGLLFQTRIVHHKKRNIYLFVTPHILREENFKDLFKYSHDYKMKAHKLGANVGAIDKNFNKYQNKYGIEEGNLRPIYMMQYKTPKKKE